MNSFDGVDNNILSTLERSFKLYRSHGPRSTAKLDELHGQIVSDLVNVGGVTAYGKGFGESREIQVQGALYPKNCDITVFTDDGVVSDVISVKFPMTNWKQNSNNYFESALGETVNLTLAGIRVHHAIFLPREVPYMSRGGEVKRVERIGDRDIDKYRLLYEQMENGSGACLPAGLFIGVVDMWDFSNGVAGAKDSFKWDDLAGLSEENQRFLGRVGSYRDFMGRVLGG